mmetsp:Transcript_49824/g.140455  ORF Transcript_49824/g.140455 Transcript_49824/m.140455 type:complete len:553 (+) Transcript_49824:130-1788(+)
MTASLAASLVPLFGLLVAAGFLAGAAANTHLRRGGLPTSPDDTHVHLLEELEGALGRTHRQATERRMARMRDALKPTFAALPKDAAGKLGQAGVRYALHRFFVEKHGWYVRGLTLAGEAWNESSPLSMLQGKVPESVFEDRLSGGGAIGLGELAVLAATLENLVHEESVKRLEDAYASHGLAVAAPVTEAQLEAVTGTYLAMYIMRLNASAAARVLAGGHRRAEQVYPGWADTVQFAGGIRSEVFDRDDVDPSSVSFGESVTSLEEFNERYGRWQDHECRSMKHDLVKMDPRGSGRVLLKDFYTAGITQFAESAAYLRQMGALDESDPARLRVIIPNYINAPSNCLASSSFYSVCCIDECEALMGQVERSISAPEATPERIAEIVSALPSATVEAPRDLPASLRGRLDEIAVGGYVPLHGRLFAQFMHHAYPRECSFPHVSGTTRPLTTSEWLRETNATSNRATKEEVQQHVESTAAASQRDGDEELPWTSEEELFCAPQDARAAPRGRSVTSTIGRVVVLGAMLLSVSVTLIRKATAAASPLKTDVSKFYV